MHLVTHGLNVVLDGLVLIIGQQLVHGDFEAVHVRPIVRVDVARHQLHSLVV